MLVDIVSVQPHFLVAQYVTDGMVERRLVPRTYMPELSSKGPVTLPDVLLDRGINYSDVDLVEVLGDYHNEISIATLQNKFRFAGLWLRDDYKTNPNTVERILRLERGADRSLDTATILNAALKPIQDGG